MIIERKKPQVYQFKMWGHRFAVDVESGNFFEIDKLVSDAISLIVRYSEQEVQEQLTAKYGMKAARGAIDNIKKLKQAKLLFYSSGNRKVLETKREISDLTLNIVNNCNLRCGYCWNRSGAYSKIEKKRMMNSKIAFQAIDLLIKESSGKKDLVIDFYGGEPLLNYGLIRDVVGYCRSSAAENRKKFRFLLATNGTLLNFNKAKFLIENGVDVAVSLDGSRQIQDKQRPFKNGEGSYDTIMDNLHSFDANLRRRLVARATFTPKSLSVIRTFKFLRGLGFDRIEICESEKAGYGLNEVATDFFFSGEEGLKELKILYYRLAGYYTEQMLRGNLTYENTYFNRFFKQLSRLYHIQSIVGTCSAGFSQIAVDVSGNLYPCTAFIGLPSFRIGSTTKGVDENKLSKFLDTRITSSKDCSICWARKICQGCGSCYNLNYFLSNDLLKPDYFYCELFRYKTKLMMAMISSITEKRPELLDEVLIPEYYATRGRVKSKI